MKTPTITLTEGKCKKCRKKGFVAASGLCLKCAGKLAIKRIKDEDLSCQQNQQVGK